MTELGAYMAGLLAMLTFAAVTSCTFQKARGQIMRTSAVIVLNWLIGLVFVAVTGNLTPWQFNIFIDIAAAILIMWHPAGRTQAYIGVFYCIQIAFHIAYGIRSISGAYADAILYYDAITYVAWGQLLAMGVWCGGIWGKNSLHNSRHHRHAHHTGSGLHHHRGGK